jgi:hypothetical protein
MLWRGDSTYIYIYIYIYIYKASKTIEISELRCVISPLDDA